MPYDKETFAGVYWLSWKQPQNYYQYIAEHVILFTGYNTWANIRNEDAAGREAFADRTKDYHGHNGKRKIYISYGGGNDNGIMSKRELDDIHNHLDEIKQDYEGVMKLQKFISYGYH